jgi:hypothetical protein
MPTRRRCSPRSIEATQPDDHRREHPALQPQQHHTADDQHRVRLIPAGLKSFARAESDRLENQRAMLAPLTTWQQTQLAAVLRILLHNFEHASASPDEADTSGHGTPRGGR